MYKTRNLHIRSLSFDFCLFANYHFFHKARFYRLFRLAESAAFRIYGVWRRIDCFQRVVRYQDQMRRARSRTISTDFCDDFHIRRRRHSNHGS